MFAAVDGFLMLFWTRIFTTVHTCVLAAWTTNCIVTTPQALGNGTVKANAARGRHYLAAYGGRSTGLIFGVCLDFCSCIFDSIIFVYRVLTAHAINSTVDMPQALGIGSVKANPAVVDLV